MLNQNNIKSIFYDILGYLGDLKSNRSVGDDANEYWVKSTKKTVKKAVHPLPFGLNFQA